ncbi:MAG TPA: 3-hydroxyacyl-CoA dehydrogenase NAD-binding domain-containing protein, partial [Bryobacteraceae bacterium]|nr:3-hydroxyacyl-CoA dehydrogenase NAD-binding domain-containing protein [Bryobacteraceae bacterium]
KPGAFFLPAGAALITPGSFNEDLASIADCDWVLEAVTEDLEIKRSLWKRVDVYRHPDALLSTNTSGIPLRQIAGGFPDSFQHRFLGTHFFNPPRYLRLVEVIPGPATEPGLLAEVAAFCDLRLGKGVVPCKDTPNFIANRIGSFYGSTVYKITVEDDFTVEEVDALTGPLIGVPKSASYRLLDIIGLDVWAFVAKNLYELVPQDPWRERFLPPHFLAQMLERKWLGEKSGQGFYKRVGPEKEIHALDWKTLEYHPAQKPRFASLEVARQIEELPDRLKALLQADDRVAQMLWRLFSDVFLYSASLIPEISDRVVDIDRAMRWGYGHALGPFELWDALGFIETADRLEREGRALPSNIVEMRRSGASGFYRYPEATSKTEYFDLGAGVYRELDPRPGVLVLKDVKRARGIVQNNAGASLVDLGEGVLCVEFHSKMNALGDDAVAMLHTGLAETERNFAAMVIANEGENFSAGANLMLILLAAQDGEWEELNAAVQRFQKVNMALKYAAKPVVAAPFSRVLGGGAEVVLHCTRSQASAELYMGLVEVGVGLIPAGGGCKEMLIRLREPRRIFELIGMAKVSGSAEEAHELGLLHKADRVSMNPERLIEDAKQSALALVTTHTPGATRHDVPVAGEAGYAAMKLGAWMMHEGAYISDHDMVIAEKLAHVLSGGRATRAGMISEQSLLDLEREAFLSLCGMPKTQERIAYMLKNGKPLRN